MPRPKGCTCGTPKPCKIHSDDGVMAGSTPAGATSDTRVGAPTDAGPLAAGILGVIEGGQSGAGQAEQAAGAKPEPDPKPKPKRKDPAPRPRKSRARKPTAPEAPDDGALIEMLSQLLTMPAIPAAMLLNCGYCRDHFIEEGPKAARELVALSITNPALRGALESLHVGFSRITIAGVLAGYLAKPLMHHVAPEPVLNAAGPVLGVPPRPQKPNHNHEHHAPDPPAEHESAAPEDDGPAPEDQYPGDQAAGIAAA